MLTPTKSKKSAPLPPVPVTVVRAPSKKVKQPRAQSPPPRPPSPTESWAAGHIGGDDDVELLGVSTKAKKTAAIPKAKAVRRKPTETETHRLPESELQPLGAAHVQTRPIVEHTLLSKSGKAAIAAVASDKQPDVRPAMALTLAEDDRPVGVPWTQENQFDYQWCREELKRLADNRCNLAFASAQPQRVYGRALQISTYLTAVEEVMGQLDSLRASLRVRLQVLYPEDPTEPTLWAFGGRRVPSVHEEAAFNVIREVAADEPKLAMTPAALKGKIAKYLSDGNKTRVSSCDWLHHMAIGIEGYTPFFEDAYMSGRTVGVMENRSPFYASLLVSLLNVFCYRQVQQPVRIRSADLCESARPALWEYARQVFTPSISMLDVMLAAIDLEADVPLQPGEMHAWPPPSLNPDASAAVPAVNERRTRLYLSYQEPGARFPPEHWLIQRFGVASSWNPSAVEFALPEDVKQQLIDLAGEAAKKLKDRTGSFVRKYGGHRVPVWATGLPLCAALDLGDERERAEERRQAVRDYLEALHEAFRRAYPDRPLPTVALPFDAPILRDIHRELGLTTREIYSTPTLVHVQVENRNEAELPPNLLERFVETQCLLVAFTAGYVAPATNASASISPLRDGDCELTPLEILFGNCHGVPLEYHQAPDDRAFVVRQRQRQCSRSSTLSTMVGRLLTLRGCTNVIVGWHLQTLLTALRLSMPETVVIDLAFHPAVRHLANQLARDCGIPAELASRLFPLDLAYGIDIRLLAALVSRPGHVIELQPGGARDLAHELLFTSMVLRQVWPVLQEGQRFRYSITAAHLVRCGLGRTPNAVAVSDPELQQAMTRPSVLAKEGAMPARVDDVEFGRALRFDSRIAFRADSVAWNNPATLASFCDALVASGEPRIRLEGDELERKEVTHFYESKPIRARIDECPLLREFCHPRAVEHAGTVDVRNCVVHSTSRLDVAAVRAHLLDPATWEDLQTKSDRQLWHIAAHYGFADSTLEVSNAYPPVFTGHPDFGDVDVGILRPSARVLVDHIGPVTRLAVFVSAENLRVEEPVAIPAATATTASVAAPLQSRNPRSRSRSHLLQSSRLR